MSSRLRRNIVRFLNFVRSCILHESVFIKFIAFRGLNAFWTERGILYCYVNDLIYGSLPIIITS